MAGLTSGSHSTWPKPGAAEVEANRQAHILAAVERQADEAAREALAFQRLQSRRSPMVEQREEEARRAWIPDHGQGHQGAPPQGALERQQAEAADWTRLHFDYVQTTFRRRSDYVLTTFWLHSDYV